jgi:hypothetical protein
MRRHFLRACPLFATHESLSLLLGSWNVNAKEEDSAELCRWLSAEEVRGADAVVVGLQELIELSPANTVIGSSFSGSSSDSSAISFNSSERWLAKLLAHLNRDQPQSQSQSQEEEEGREFMLLESQSMVGIVIYVFVRQSWRSRMRNVQARSISRGGGGLLGNKGAVCVRFEVNDTSFCFCSSHLCAHREDVLKRNEDFRIIYNTPVFQPPSFAAVQRVKSDSGRSTRNMNTAAAASRLKSKLARSGSGVRAVAEDLYLRKVKVRVHL